MIGLAFMVFVLSNCENGVGTVKGEFAVTSSIAGLQVSTPLYCNRIFVICFVLLLISFFRNGFGRVMAHE